MKDDLFEFRMAPGDRYAEQELANRLGVSRTPLRFALFMLAREGYLVKLDGHGGWMVRPLDFSLLRGPLRRSRRARAMAIQKICTADPSPDLRAAVRVLARAASASG